MDVICEQCGAEYEFDETLLSDKGTTVKCSACGHVFRVMPQNRELGRAQLMLRPAQGGRDLPLASLRDLQQRIAGGEVSLDDQIGREGHPFRPLHEIPELKNFFARSAEKTTAEPQPGTSKDGPPTVRRPTGTLMGSTPSESFGDQRLTPTVPAPPGSVPEASLASLPPPPATPRVGGQPAARDNNPAKRTIMGVGPTSEAPTGTRPDPAQGNATLGPAAAMASAAAREPKPPVSAPRAGGGSVTPTLLGTPGAPQAAARDQRPPPPAKPAIADRPAANAASSERPIPAAAPAPAGLRVSPGGLPGLQLPPSSSYPPAPSGRPAAMGSYSPPAPQGAERSSPPVAVGPAGRVQLYLSDDEKPPTSTIRRASSKLWLVALILIVLGGAGWFGVHMLAGPGQGTAPPTASVSPDPSTTTPPSPAAATPTPPAEPAPKEAQAEAPSAPAEPAPPTPSPESTTPPPAAPAASATEKPATEKAGKGKTATESPKPERVAEAEDYGQLIARAAQLAKRGDQAGAIKLYRAALGLRPTAAEANTGLGFALLATGKASEALPLFDRAVSDGFVDANIGLGDAYRKLGQPSSAIEAYRTYLERMPSGSRANYARQAIAKLEGGGAAASPAGGAGDSYRPAGELEAPPSAPAPAPAPEPKNPAPPTTPSGPEPLPERPIAPSEPSP